MKYLVIVLMFFALENNYAQKNCCDSIKALLEHKKTYRKKIPSKNTDIIITVDNSNNANNFSRTGTMPESEVRKTNSDDISLFDWDDLLKIILAILVALIAGLIALYQMKSNIISSSRIKWNEDLRDSLSKFYSAVLDCHCANRNYVDAKKANDKEGKDSHYTEYSNYHSTYNSLANKVMMLLNSDDKEHQKIEKNVSKIDEMLQPENIDSISQGDLEKQLKEIVKSSKIIFKMEWNKSKKLFKI